MDMIVNRDATVRAEGPGPLPAWATAGLRVEVMPLGTLEDRLREYREDRHRESLTAGQYSGLKNWAEDSKRGPAGTVFTAGLLRDAATAVEAALKGQRNPVANAGESNLGAMLVEFGCCALDELFVQVHRIVKRLVSQKPTVDRLT